MLKGKKVILRPLKMADLDRTHEWRNNLDSIKLTLGIRFPKSFEMDKEWFDHTLRDKYNRSVYLGIDECESCIFIGIIQITNIDWISGVAEFGINIGDKTKAGMGYGKEAMNLFFDYVFNILGLRKINLKVASFNENAIHAYYKQGFKQEGILKDQVYFNNEYFDVILMALFKSTFNK